MQKYKSTIKNGHLEITNLQKFKGDIKSLKDGNYEITLKPIRQTRTIQQNSALHLWFSQVAEAMNEAGLDIQLVLKDDISAPLTGTMIKEIFWRRVQKAVLDKKSTTKLNKLKEIDFIFDILNKHFGEKFGIHVPFPSKETLEEEHRKYLNNQ